MSSSTPKQKVADYLMSVHFGIAHKVDGITRIRVKDKVMWAGNATANTVLSINLPKLFGGNKKEGGLRGLVHILIGAGDQTMPVTIASKMGGTPETVPGFRGVTSIFFTGGGDQKTNGFYWSSNQPYLPTVDVTAYRAPVGLDPTKATLPGTVRTVNPAHIIYECLTNTDWGLGLPASFIDTVSFTAAANTLYNEGFGLGMQWTGQSSIESFVDEVLKHIDATYGIDPATGKIYLKLIREDYSVDGLPELKDEDSRVTRFQRKGFGETVNEVIVTWTNPENEEEETVSVHDRANYAVQGQLVSSSSNYYGVRTNELALRLAMRDLGKGAYPTASIEMQVNRKAWDYKPGDVVKVYSNEYGITGLIARVMTVDYGRPGSGAVRVSLLEDVFTLPDDAFVDEVGSEWENTSAAPAPLLYAQGGSVPYYFVAQQNGSAAAAAMPATSALGFMFGIPASQDSRSFDLHAPVTNALGVSVYSYLDTLTFVGRGELTGSIGLTPSSSGVTLSNLKGFIPPSAGMFCWIGSTPATSELALISAYNDSTGAITLYRGILDTNPKAWPAGTPVWLFSPELDVSEPTVRVPGATVNYKATPTTSQGTLDVATAPVNAVTISARQHMPYRPANVRIATQQWPTLVENAATTALSWSRRNRLMEDPTVLQWTGGDVTPETGQTTTATLYRADTNALLTQVSGIAGTSQSLSSTYSGQVKLQLTSSRDGLTSFQPFEHTYLAIATQLLIAEDGEWLMTEGGEELITET